MKTIHTCFCLLPLAVLLSACGSDTEKTTVVHDQPIIVPATSAQPVVVEHHYDE